MKKALLIILMAACAARGAKTRSFSLSGYGTLKEGTTENLSLDHLGVLRLAPSLTEYAALDEPVVWCAAAAPDGLLYLGTGSQGKILRVSAEAKTEVFFDPDEVLVRALAADSKGRLYAGASPSGRIYRLTPDGRAEVFFDAEDKYIWDMVFDSRGNLFAATGASARIYRLPPDYQLGAEPEIWFSCGQTHLTALAWDTEERLLAGSNPGGILYRAAEKGRGRALFNSGDEEVKSILPRPGGDILMATFSENESPAVEIGAPFPIKKKNSQKHEKGEKPENPSSPSGNNDASKGAGKIYLMDPGGFVETLWAAPRFGIFSLARAGADTLLAGTNDGGKIFRVKNRGEWELLQQTQNGGAVSVLLADPLAEGALLVCTSNPGKIYRLENQPAEKGLYTSAPLDAKQIARWGRLLPLGAGSDVSGLSFRARSGNTPDPDDTWSGWSEISLQHGEGEISCPPARYLQYEATLRAAGSAAAPSLRRVTIFYQIQNAAPVVGEIRLLPLAAEPQKIEPKHPRLNLEQILQSQTPETFLEPPKKHTKLNVTGEHGYFTAVWRAFDPNGDSLLYTVSLKQEQKAEWVSLREKLEDPVAAINTKGLPEGYYRLRVQAADNPDNPPGEALTGSRESEIFLIDNTPPELALKQIDINGSTAELVFEAADTLSVLGEAAFILDGGSPQTVQPLDGLFDSRRETFVLRLDKLEPGPHSLVFEAKDQLGRAAIRAVNFTIEK